MHTIGQLLEDRLLRTAELGVAIPSPRLIAALAVAGSVDVAAQHARFAAELHAVVFERVVAVVMGDAAHTLLLYAAHRHHVAAVLAESMPG